jgi:hypothetical protein
MWEWKTHDGLSILLQLPHFWPILELTWLILWIFTRWLLKGVHFEPLQVHEMKVSQKVGQKVEGWNINFHKWKGIWIYKKCLNQFPFQRKTPRKKNHFGILCLCSSIMCRKNIYIYIKRRKNIPNVNLIP